MSPRSLYKSNNYDLHPARYTHTTPSYPAERTRRTDRLSSRIGYGAESLLRGSGYSSR